MTDKHTVRPSIHRLMRMTRAAGRKLLLQILARYPNADPILIQQMILQILYNKHSRKQKRPTIKFINKSGKPDIYIQKLLSIITNRIPYPLIYMTEEHSPKLIVTFDSTGQKRASYIHELGFMVLDDDLDHILHEYIHRIQHLYKIINEMYMRLHQQRTRWDTPELLIDLYPNSLYDPAEETRKDNYIDYYFGKDCEGRPMEVMAMAIQIVLGYNKDLFIDLCNEDREMLELTIGLLMEYDAQWL